MLKSGKSIRLSKKEQQTVDIVSAYQVPSTSTSPEELNQTMSEAIELIKQTPSPESELLAYLAQDALDDLNTQLL